MIADTSIWIDFFRGKTGDDLDLFRRGLNDGQVVMAPAVLSELLSSTKLTGAMEKSLCEMEFAEPFSDFWSGCGKLRRRLTKMGFNASLADCLVVQSCLERGLPLLTRDQGLKKFGPKIGLLLL